MNRKRKMNGEATAIRSNVYNGPFAGLAMEPDASVRPPWYKRRLIDMGVLEMAPSTKPPGLTINITTATFYLLILSFIAAGFWWTWQRAEQSGIQLGRQQVEKETQQKEMEALKEELKKAQEKAQQAMNVAAAK